MQHVRAEGWAPTPDLGASDGVHAAYHAFTIGFPPGVNVWCDLEGVATGTGRNWLLTTASGTAVAAAGYLPGLYVGANAILSGQALQSLRFSHSWKSLSNVPDMAVRSYQMILSNEKTLNGIDIDENQTARFTWRNPGLVVSGHRRPLTIVH